MKPASMPDGPLNEEGPSLGEPPDRREDLQKIQRIKSVKFSAWTEQEEVTKGGQKVVTVVDAPTQQSSQDAHKSRAAARRRRLWRQISMYLKPRFWAHMLNRALPMLQPESTARRSWDSIIIVMVIFNCVLIPYQVGFSTPAPEVINPVNNVIDILFAIDIVLNFRTCYWDDSAKLVRDGTQVAFKYLRTWFAIDLLATIPYDLLLSIIPNNLSSQQLTALALLRTPRLLRLVRIFRMADRVRGANIIRMLKLLFLMATIAHMIACLWHLIYVLDKRDRMWTFDELGNSAEITVFLQGYLNTLFIMIGNDVFPGNDIERLYCTFVLVLGACFYAIVVGNMSLLVNNLNPTASRHRFKKDIIINTIRYLDIPKDLARRINVYFEFLTQYSHPGTDGTTLISQLPSSMAQDINSWCYKTMIMKVPLFTDCEEAFITQLVMRIRLSVYLTGEVIFKIGDVGHEMYFISKGDVAVINGNSEMLAMLGKGGFFGELALLATARRTAHCVSLSQCDLAMLMANDLVSAMRDFPDSAASVRACAVNRLNELQAAGNAAAEETDSEEEEEEEDDDRPSGGAEYPHEHGAGERESSGSGQGPAQGDTRMQQGFSEAEHSEQPLPVNPFRTDSVQVDDAEDEACGESRNREGRGQNAADNYAANRPPRLEKRGSAWSSGLGSRQPSHQLSHQVSQRSNRAASPAVGDRGKVLRGTSFKGRGRGISSIPGISKPVVMTFDPNNVKAWMDSNMNLIGQMVILVQRLNSKMDTVKGRLDGIRNRISNVEKTQSDLQVQTHTVGMQDAFASAMLDFDRDL